MGSQQGNFYRFWLILAAVVALFAGVWAGSSYMFVSSNVPSAEIRGGTVITQPRQLAPFNLRDDRGKTFNLDSLRGHWTFVAIGYTHCPDICPTTLATFARIESLVNAAKSNAGLEFVFISVDPERDTVERLGDYVRYFNPGFRGATGSQTELESFTKQLGLVFVRVENQANAPGYLVDHSASILLIDPFARLAAVFGAPQNPEVMAKDFLVISR